MLTYDYECEKCGAKKENEIVESRDTPVICECKNAMTRLFPTGMGGVVFPSGGVHLEHVSAAGKTFYSKKEMRKYERDNKVELGYLL